MQGPHLSFSSKLGLLSLMVKSDTLDEQPGLLLGLEGAYRV